MKYIIEINLICFSLFERKLGYWKNLNYTCGSHWTGLPGWFARGWQTMASKAKSGLLPVLVNMFYWNTATLIHLHIVYGCFCTTSTKMSSCHGDVTARKAKDIYSLALYRKRLLIPA